MPSHRHMTMKATDVVTDQAAELAACLFHSLSDRSRLTILVHLTLGEHRVVELTEHLGLAQSTVSAHLACLRDCGLVESRPVGRASVFSLKHSDEVLGVLAAAERLLAATDWPGEQPPSVVTRRAL